MNIYINILWILSGVPFIIYGRIVTKNLKFNMIYCIGKNKVKDKDGFSEFYGKAITFLGCCLLVSGVICIGSKDYLSVSSCLTALGIIYFILESFHLVNLYKNAPEQLN